LDLPLVLKSGFRFSDFPRWRGEGRGKGTNFASGMRAVEVKPSPFRGEKGGVRDLGVQEDRFDKKSFSN